MGEPALRTYTYAEYLELEEASLDVKHEWEDGVILPMAGGTRDHSLLAANLMVQFGVALRGRPCRAYTSDARMRVPATGLATYPDLTVVCGQAAPHPEDKDAITNPVLLVEVLSESTEQRDRGRKLAHYETIESLRHYLLVSQDQVRIEHFQRAEAGSWRFKSYGSGGRIPLPDLDVVIDVDELYAETELLAGTAP